MSYNSDEIFSFILCHAIFLFQIVFVGYIDDEYVKLDYYHREIKYQNYYLTLNKIIFYIILFLCYISLIRTIMTDPGKITSKNNINIIQFYYFLHKGLIENAINLTEKKTEKGIREIIFKANNIKFDPNANYSLDNDDDFANDSEKDEYKFKLDTSIDEEIKIALIRKYRIKLTRCKSCYSVRPHITHHCKKCHRCVLVQDHHCPWIGNCIGAFNRKFFILYNFYAVICVVYSLLIFAYFVLHKHFDLIYGNATYIVFSVIFVCVSIVYGIFTFMMVYEQFENARQDKNIIDYNNGFLLEKSTFMHQLYLIFGGQFSLKWLLPFFNGGYYHLYVKLCKKYKKEIIENDDDENNDDEDEPLLNKEKRE